MAWREGKPVTCQRKTRARDLKELFKLVNFFVSADNPSGLETFQPPGPGVDMCPI
jgi:hypothetical protein